MSRKRPINARIDGLCTTPQPVILPICPRSPAVRGRNFTATVDAMIGHADPLHILLCDTLDRHNLQGPDALQHSLDNGDAWLADAMPHIIGRFERITLKRWNDVTQDPGFAPRLDAFNRLYDTNAAARQAVDNIASWYLSAKRDRLNKLGLSFHEATERYRSTAYLLEEFAGTATYATWYPGAPEAYWGVYVGRADLFQRLAPTSPWSLILPDTLPVKLSRLGEPTAGESTNKKSSIWMI